MEVNYEITNQNAKFLLSDLAKNGMDCRVLVDDFLDLQ